MHRSKSILFSNVKFPAEFLHVRLTYFSSTHTHAYFHQHNTKVLLYRQRLLVPDQEDDQETCCQKQDIQRAQSDRGNSLVLCFLHITTTGSKCLLTCRLPLCFPAS